MHGLDNFVDALTPINLAFALFGVAAGTIIGAIPGLTATMAVAVLVPLTFTLDPASALILLGAIYTGAIYGGAYSAILLNTPGTPSAIPTTFDGYPMAKQGNGDLAVTLSCLASVVGGLVGAAALLLLAPPLSNVALAFGPVEYFWLAIFGLSLIAALSEGNVFKGLAGGAFGLLLSTIGVAEVSADVRLTFGIHILLGGIEVVAALIGLYCIPVLIDLAAHSERHLDLEDSPRGFRLAEAVRVMVANKFNVARSSIIGTIVGILPGAGGSVAGLVSYSEARRTARADQRYGSGEPGGVIASESANNATVGGGLIPTLVLGIPGTPPDAIILGALLVQGVHIGPTLFANQGAIVYTFVWGLFLATVLMLPVGLLIGRYAYKSILNVPKPLLVAGVAFMTIIGSYAIRNSSADVAIMVILGLAGWVLSRFRFSVSPIVLGLILGPIAEQGFVQGWTIGSAIGNVPAMFFGRPLSLAVIAFTLLTLLWPVYRARRNRVAMAAGDEAPAIERSGPQWGSAAISVLLIIFGLLALNDARGYTDSDSLVFPVTVAIGLIVFAGIVLVRSLLGLGEASEGDGGSFPRRAILVLTMLACALLMESFGFVASSIALFVILTLVGMHERWTVRTAVIYAIAGLVIVFGFTWLFRSVLGVPLPVMSL
ncbi:tripartite tricarboxylate transporter permease [Pararhizobium mangrovi]|uniref:C4-dicarboxylate ABC transporter permease n=1 Tax=Pararhizobium mangrovi TaxID=2590452 RepID=A0A506UEL0_9HYPH|nr:tripartite tricarboxylate transporter permease [Pararhizobium mangrovi]TPW31896.1 C4-dicarboxylate ABC transporter permease [Pararhizobium mangrovi]